MSKKFRNKYRIESNRLQGWDYAGNGFYFITIVTNNRINWFGKIENKKMILSGFGKIIEKEWIKSFEIRDELFLDDYVLMPNHLHAIVILNKPSGFNDFPLVEVDGRPPLQFYGQTINRDEIEKPLFQRKPKSISSFVAGYKSATTNKIDDFIDDNNLTTNKFNVNNRLWQINYHDHVIRNEAEYFKIKNYIKNNPSNWCDDKFNT